MLFDLWSLQLVPEAEEKPVEKKFLAIPDVRSEEIEYEDDVRII